MRNPVVCLWLRGHWLDGKRNKWLAGTYCVQSFQGKQSLLLPQTCSWLQLCSLPCLGFNAKVWWDEAVSNCLHKTLSQNAPGHATFMTISVFRCFFLRHDLDAQSIKAHTDHKCIHPHTNTQYVHKIVHLHMQNIQRVSASKISSCQPEQLEVIFQPPLKNWQSQDIRYLHRVSTLMVS